MKRIILLLLIIVAMGATPVYSGIVFDYIYTIPLIQGQTIHIMEADVRLDEIRESEALIWWKDSTTTETLRIMTGEVNQWKEGIGVYFYTENNIPFIGILSEEHLEGLPSKYIYFDEDTNTTKALPYSYNYTIFLNPSTGTFDLNGTTMNISSINEEFTQFSWTEKQSDPQSISQTNLWIEDISEVERKVYFKAYTMRPSEVYIKGEKYAFTYRYDQRLEVYTRHPVIEKLYWDGPNIYTSEWEDATLSNKQVFRVGEEFGTYTYVGVLNDSIVFIRYQNPVVYYYVRQGRVAFWEVDKEVVYKMYIDDEMRLVVEEIN